MRSMTEREWTSSDQSTQSVSYTHMHTVIPNDRHMQCNVEYPMQFTAATAADTNSIDLKIFSPLTTSYPSHTGFIPTRAKQSNKQNL